MDPEEDGPEEHSNKILVKQTIPGDTLYMLYGFEECLLLDAVKKNGILGQADVKKVSEQRKQELDKIQKDIEREFELNELELACLKEIIEKHGDVSESSLGKDGANMTFPDFRKIETCMFKFECALQAKIQPYSR